ncbi:MAG: carboxymuconolactone decarboxylase family protein [Candidatus Methylomirabilales bacterium]
MYSELERLVLRFAEDLTKKARTDEAVFQGLRNHLSEQELVELHFAVGIANLTNRFNDSLLTDLEQ